MGAIRVGIVTATLCAVGACGSDSTTQAIADAAVARDGSTVTIDAAGGGSDAGGGPDARDGGGGNPGADAGANPDPDAGNPHGDAGPTPGNDAGPGGPGVMSLWGIAPAAASRGVSTPLKILGFNIAPGATLRLASCDTPTTYDLTPAVAGDGRAIDATLAASPTREQGIYDVVVTNPDGASDTLTCALRVSAAMPPTVSSVSPTSAYAGALADGLLSDELVVLTGTGFDPTPAVRWTATDGRRSYQAQTVTWISATQLTAVVPAETLGMAPGEYRVTVQNPDLLEGTWAGVFTITTVAPPRITGIEPVRIENGSCTSSPVTLGGAGFHPAAGAYHVAPGASGCAGGVLDPNGDRLCPMTVLAQSATSMTVRFPSCPGTGPWPLAVRNPDGQTGLYYSLEVTPSADGHLNQDDFETLPARLVTARWRHAATYSFDAFGHAFLVVAGGQDAARAVLGSVEISQLTVHGVPGPFALAEQYGGPTSPRVANALAVPRNGHTLLRAGKTLYAIGGATQPTDRFDVVPGTASVERATVLSYDEMPRVRPLVEIGAAGLPRGTWYYQVAALGPWGEGLGSLEVQTRTTAGGAIQVCWTAVPQATAYNVYRSLASDGRAGSTALVATAVPAPCTMDSGAVPPAPGRLRGGVTTGTRGAGTFAYRVAALTASGETQASYAAEVSVTAGDVGAGNGAVALFWDEVPGATGYRVYRRDGGGYRLLDTGPVTARTLVDDALPFSADGAPRPEIRPLRPGSLSRWAEVPPAQFLTTPRDGVDGVVIRLDPDAAGAPIARLLVAGGRASNQSADAYHTTAESIAVAPDGSLDGAWELEAAEFDTPRAFFALLTTQDRNVTPFPPPPEEPPCPDRDGDGWMACGCAPAGTTCDCDDGDPGVHPGAEEVCGDGIDQDCDGEDPTCQCVTDADGDGAISQALCDGGDCCDSGAEASLGCSVGNAPGIGPEVTEVCGDGIDQDCDGMDPACQCTLDVDGDGHRALACLGDDCCDSGAENALGCTAATAPGIHPGAEEICGDAVDQDCDGIDPGCQCTLDADGDGHLAIACGGDDCCDAGTEASVGCTPGTAGGIFPGNREICGDGIDQNCNGTDLICKAPTASALAFARPQVAGDEAVFVVAVQGDGGLTRGASSTVATGLTSFEACGVDLTTGRLSCGDRWVTQSEMQTPSREALGLDALLYFHYLFPFTAAEREVCTASASGRDLSSSSIGRYEVHDPDGVADGNVIGPKQSGSAKFMVNRSHYQLVRLMSYIFAIGGWTDAGPTDTVERHLQ